MTNSSLIDDAFGSLTFNDRIKAYLSETANWAKFLSILGFIYVGIMAVSGLFAGSLFAVFAQDVPEFNLFFNPVYITILFMVATAIAFFPVLFLFRFADQMQKALRAGDETSLTRAFQNLKMHYKFIGIVTIISLSLYLLLILFSVIVTIAYY